MIVSLIANPCNKTIPERRTELANYAAKTDVQSDKSRIEIERTLERYGATHFGYMSEPGSATVAFRMDDRQVRFSLPLPPKDSREFTHHSRGARTASAAAAEYEQAIRQKWRALSLVVKAKLEAVASGIAEFDQEFFAYVVLPSGQTVYEQTHEQVSRMISSQTPGPLMLEGKK
ncbi:hypothetical protein [Lysinibacter cavernae]|uniref:hypothetical protein n=1 Tax=Lysinibacter cavernae TaxID=1640652 RepID=UPI00360CC180